MRLTNRLLLLFFLFSVCLCSCEKKEGKTFLRVLSNINADASITVKDANSIIPVDSNYHEVSGYIETEYKLFDVVWDSITNWTPNCILERVWRTNRTVNRYFGDIEKLPEDHYYTLLLQYKIEYSDPIVYSWLNEYSYRVSNVKYTYYNLTFTYSDNSSLTYTMAP